METGKIAVREHKKGDLGTMELEMFIRTQAAICR
jgi:hypothetical protein